MVGTQYIGRTLGRYRVTSVIGSGGFATVYRAVDTGLERSVALKVVDPAAHHNPTVARRFVREGQAVASLDHPAVVPVYDTGETDGVLWLAMRLIEGGSLDDALRAGRRLTADQVAAIAGRIGGALDHAHGQGLVHRDVKPSNILLEDNDPWRAWLVDFGIAVSARTAGQYTTGALGTAAYMAPEQSRPGGAGPAADVYSLGCVAYEMVTGNRPFPGDDYVALLMAHANEPVPAIGHPRLDDLFGRALAKLPTARPATATGFAAELREALATGVGTTTLLPLDDLLTAAGSAPTVVEPRHDTLLHPEVHRPPPPVAAPGPPAVTPDHRPPPPMAPPGPALAGHRPPPPIHPPAARQGRARIVVGLLTLLVAATTTLVVLQLATRSDTKRVEDAQGIDYRVPRDWDMTSESPVTEWADSSGQVVATLQNYETGDGDTAAGRLEDLDPAVCDLAPVELDPRPTGSDTAAICTNPADSDIAVALAATGRGQLWVVTLHRTVPEADRAHFIADLELTN